MIADLNGLLPAVSSPTTAPAAAPYPAPRRVLAFSGSCAKESVASQPASTTAAAHTAATMILNRVMRYSSI
jgi:hypothetical protein